jgi:hypothetical protein
MSEGQDEADDAPETDADEEPTAPSKDAESNGQPEIDEESRADLDGLDVDTSDLEPSEGEDGKEAGDGADAGEGDPGMAGGAGEWGDMYVQLCKQATNGIIEKHGGDHEVDEAHFRAVDLDDHFNRCLEKYTGGSDMPPEQALLVGTAMAVGGPVALHTDIPAELAGEFDV